MSNIIELILVWYVNQYSQENEKRRSHNTSFKIPQENKGIFGRSIKQLCFFEQP